MKSKIVFDSNFLWKNHSSNIGDVFNSNLENIIDFVDKHNKEDIIISIPEVVVEERLTQQSEQIFMLAENTKKAAIELRGVGIKVEFPKKMPQVRESLQKKTKKYLNNKSVETIYVPKLDQDSLLKRAYERTHPFTKSDKGFKDTLLWLSVLEDARLNPKTDYLLCTNNKEDFDLGKLRKEFKLVSQEELLIIDSLQDIKEYLDNKYRLQLELKERNAEIESDIKKKIDELMLKFNIFAGEQIDRSMRTVLASDMFQNRVYSTVNFGYSSSRRDFWDKYIGYGFSNMSINNISELIDGTFQVDIDLEVNATKKDKNDDSSLIRNVYEESSFISKSIINNPFYNDTYGNDIRKIAVSVSLNYDTASKTFQIIAAAPNSYPY